MGAVAYVECSAETGFCVKEVFETAVQAVTNPAQINPAFKVQSHSKKEGPLSLLWHKVTRTGQRTEQQASNIPTQRLRK